MRRPVPFNWTEADEGAEPWFVGPGWYVTDDCGDLQGPFDSKLEAERYVDGLMFDLGLLEDGAEP